MTTSLSAQRVLQALLLSSLGLWAVELLRPVDVHAETCTLDPFGGEVCLPDDDDNDDGDDPKRMVIVPPLFRALHPVPTSSALPPVRRGTRTRTGTGA